MLKDSDFETKEKVLFADLFDGRLRNFGIKEPPANKMRSTPERRCITDGKNYVWFSRNEGGFLYSIACYGGNNPMYILNKISEAFETSIYLVKVPYYLRNEKARQFIEWQVTLQLKGLSDQEKQALYQDLFKYLSNDLKSPNTTDALIVKELVNDQPELVNLENKDEFLEAFFALRLLVGELN